MAIKRTGNKIEFTGNDASKLARAVLPSMKDLAHQSRNRKSYTIYCKYMTAKPGRGAGSVVGGSGTGEVDITIERGTLSKQNSTDADLLAFCKQALQANPKMKSNVISVQITDIKRKS